MSGFEDIREHMEVIGADGVHLGTVDRVEENRIKLIRADSGVGHEEHHHFIPRGLVAEVEGNPGYYSAKFFLRPHYQLEGLTVSLRLVSKLPSAKAS